MQLSRIIAHVALAAAIAASAVSPTDAASGWMTPSRNTNTAKIDSVAETTQRKLGEGGGFGAAIQTGGNNGQEFTFAQNSQGDTKPNKQEFPVTQSVYAQNGQGGNTGEEKQKNEQQKNEQQKKYNMEQQKKEKKEQLEKKKEQQEKAKKEQQEKAKKEQQEKEKTEQQEKEKTEQQEKVNVPDQNVQPGKGIPILQTWDDLEQSLKH
ncbi:unnamed protein product [Peronospora farinosa]|uniref:Uncharacterized protein n=1 Tax=Peronospora farinosa TaxID=134698 RepID=A0ABN8CI46_9STRA|nr:unnamed protein product [Peronospora farinosa]